MSARRQAGPPTIKSTQSAVKLLLALACLLLLGGCAVNEEDRSFFQDGWRHPEQGAEKRMNEGW